jgi:hypothetical protein
VRTHSTRLFSPSLVVFHQKLWIDHLEAEAAADVFVVLFNQWTEHDSFALDLRIQPASAFRTNHQLVNRVIQRQPPKLRDKSIPNSARIAGMTP